MVDLSASVQIDYLIEMRNDMIRSAVIGYFSHPHEASSVSACLRGRRTQLRPPIAADSKKDSANMLEPSVRSEPLQLRAAICQLHFQIPGMLLTMNF